MGKKVVQESKSGASVKSGVKAVKGMNLDTVKSAMTPDKVKVATPGNKKKEKLVGTPVPVRENKDKSKSAKKEKKNGAETPAAKTPKGKENVEQAAKSATKKKNKGPPIEVKHLEFSTIESGVSSFLKMLKSQKSTKKVDPVEKDSDVIGEKVKSEQLFEEDGEASKVFLQVAGIKRPRLDDTTMINCTLPNGWVEKDGNILLLVKDFKRDIKHDHEETLLHYEEMIRKANIPANIEVMPCRQLRVEYREYEVRATLVKRIERVLCDKRIMDDAPRHLGKPFYSKKKIPISVDMAKQDLKEEIMRGIKTSLLPINNHGNCTTAAVGRTNQTEEELSQNIEAMVKRIRGKYPGGWKNIRSVALMSNNKSIFLYMSERNTDEVPEVFTDEFAANNRAPVEDELSTIPGATVIVHQSGAVTVKRVADPEWDEEVEGVVDERHPELDDDDIEIKDTNYKKKQKVEEKSADKSSKKSKVEDRSAEKSAKKKKKEEDSDDDDMDKMEMEYMKRVAAEEEQMEKKEKENLKKLKEAGKDKSKAKDAEEENSDAEEKDSDAEEKDSDVEEDSDAEDDSDAEEDSDAEDDSDADDDIEAENLVSDGEDSDAGLDESELFRKREEAEEENTPQKKKKPSKKEKRQEIKNIKANKPGGKLHQAKGKPSPKNKTTPQKHLSKGSSSGKGKLSGVKAGKIKKSKK